MKKRFPVSSTAFIAAVSAYFTFFLSIKFWLYVFEKVEIDSIKDFLFACTLPFFIYIPLLWFFSLIVVPKVGKWAVMILLVLSAASDYALQNLGIVINSDMIRNFAETNLREASDFFTFHSVCYVFVVGIVPAILVFFADIRFFSFKNELKTRLLAFFISLALVGVSAAAFYKEYASFGRNNKEVRYYINTFNYIYAVGRYYKRAADANRKFVILDAAPTINPNKSAEPRVVVLIVGETARAQNFSLYGYAKNTNPLLSERSDIIVFDDVYSCGTSTAISLPCMFSQLPKKKFSVTDALYQQNLLDIAKLAGYDIIWKDNYDGCKKVCDRIGKIDARAGNKQPYCFGDYCYDDILIDGLDDTLKSVKKDTLIVLHAMGSHGPTYYKRYPDKFKLFTPACDSANLQDCTQEQITNSYDNTIAYTDYTISSVIDILKQNPQLQTSMLYVSDHGESLGENNIYLHGLPYAIAPDEQKKVPMILWLSETAQNNLNIDRKCLQTEAKMQTFSHDNYFHSVLNLLDISSSAYNPDLDLFHKCRLQ